MLNIITDSEPQLTKNRQAYVKWNFGVVKGLISVGNSLCPDYSQSREKVILSSCMACAFREFYVVDKRKAQNLPSLRRTPTRGRLLAVAGARQFSLRDIVIVDARRPAGVQVGSSAPERHGECF